jgi:UDP-N-acetylglucosamine--N-acetylmuramyl-(pentapeptide) pyrophosphoryl-undecaprenol N-acetylglucosamine transferase
LAVAEELGLRGHEVLFAGSPSGQEARIVPEQGLPYKAFNASGFNRSRPWTLLTSSVLLALSTGSARKWLMQEKPDAVAGFGGYVSVPVGRAAAGLNIPLLIHEQNSAAGWANRYLANKAQAVALTFDDARAALELNQNALVALTGNPVRRSLLEAAKTEARTKARQEYREAKNIPSDAHLLMVFGGSQGARHINQAVVALRERLMAVEGLYILHITGAKELTSVRSILAGPDDTGAGEHFGGRWITIGYCDEMPAAYSASDFAVSRAGAGSLSEIAAMRLPAILVPYPFATNDHQRANARSLVQTGAAVMIDDADLDTSAFANELLDILSSVPRQLSMQKAARSLPSQNAAAAVADMLCEIATSQR